MKNFTQNPSGISTVRVSAVQNITRFDDLDLAHTKVEIMDCLRESGFTIRQGTSGDNIKLSGNNGVQAHIRASDAYVFFGKPSLVELLKLASLFVGLQTLDPDLHFESEGIKYRRPVVIYGDPQHFMPLFEMAMNMHTKVGTVRQDPHSLIRFASKPDELIAVLKDGIPAENSIHGHGATPDEVASAIQYYTENTYFEPEDVIAKPNFSVVTYTSASRESQEAYDFAVFLAENGIGCVSGAGQVGSMGAIARGSFAAGGYSYGTNCAHIAAQEGVPKGMIVKIKPCIYSRMGDMKSQGNAIICGTGGYGGMGTMQEMLAGAVLTQQRSHLMTNGRNKPIILDNSLGLWEGVNKLFGPFGFEEGRNFVAASSHHELKNLTLNARDGKLSLSIPQHSRGLA